MKQSTTLSLLPTLGMLLFTGACEKTEPPSKEAPRMATEATSLAAASGAAASGAATSGGAASGASSSKPSTSASAAGSAGKAEPKPLTAKQQSAFLRELGNGRRLAAKKDWAGSMKAFERALAISPNEPRALGDIGWVAFQANDLDRAEATNQRALLHANEPKQRASILYNIGRVAEARNKKDEAREVYTESLALRDNAEVKKRLEALGGAAGPPAGQGEQSVEACQKPFPDVQALCACLKKTDFMIPADEKFVCAPPFPAPDLGHADLGVLVYGAESMGERVHMLTIKEKGGVHALVELGRDFEPGAFGVHNEAKVIGGQKRAVGGHTVIVVSAEQRNNDSNMAGLELCTYSAKIELVCAVGEGKGATRCGPALPVEVESGCGPGVEPDPSEMDDEMKQAVAEIKKNQKKSSGKAAWTLSDDGKLTVKLKEGAGDLIDPEVFKPRSLW